MEAPFALLRQQQGRLLLVAVNPAAAAAGLTPGQPLAAARILVPDLVVRPEEAAADRAALRRLLDWGRRYSPWVALDPASALGEGEGVADDEAGFGGDAALWLDITGCGHLFGGEAALVDDLLRRLARGGLGGRAGVAATPGAAWALARHATDPAHPTAVLAPEADLARALAQLPLAGLRLAPATLELLRRLGLEQIGQLYELPPATLAPRFGPLLAQRLRQALGQLPEAIGPARLEEPLWVRRAFAEPLSTPEDLGRVLALLAEELAALLARRGLGARRLDLAGHRVDGSVTRLSVGLSRPGRDPRHWLRLFQPKQDRLDPGFGIEVVTLAAPLADTLVAEQGRLSTSAAAVLPLPQRERVGVRGGGSLHLVPEAPADPTHLARALSRASSPSAEGVGLSPELPADLAALVDRLENRLGREAVRRLDLLERHWPEDAVAATAPAAPRPADRPVWASPRPLYLLRRPEPLEAVELRADQAPAGFTWRRRHLTLSQAEGPERITPAWWQPGRAGEAPRDYWQVEDQEGRRYWLYRSETPAGVPPRWFVHGLFA